MTTIQKCLGLTNTLDNDKAPMAKVCYPGAQRWMYPATHSWNMMRGGFPKFPICEMEPSSDKYEYPENSKEPEDETRQPVIYPMTALDEPKVKRRKRKCKKPKTKVLVVAEKEDNSLIIFGGIGLIILSAYLYKKRSSV